jgi:DNA-directed RNA polymerase alpha subunit
VKADYENDRLLDTVYPEMDRMETLEREEQRKKHPEWRSVQKNGNAVRFINVAKGNDIETVGQLLAVGRAGFERLRFMGRVCADEVSKALDNLYGIKQW